jgi:hypothetical protein
MKRLLGLALIVVSTVLAQPHSYGNVQFSGNIPITFCITDNNNSGGIAGAISTLTVGYGSRSAPTIRLRLRGNHTYKLMANASIGYGIIDGPATAPSTTPQALKTGDIGFGFTEAVDTRGASVVNGGYHPTRKDVIATGFDATNGFVKTLHDIYGVDTQILSGDRISASGNNSSSDNFLLITIGVSSPSGYFTPGPFGGTITFTISAP